MELTSVCMGRGRNMLLVEPLVGVGVEGKPLRLRLREKGVSKEAPTGVLLLSAPKSTPIIRTYQTRDGRGGG